MFNELYAVFKTCLNKKKNQGACHPSPLTLINLPIRTISQHIVYADINLDSEGILLYKRTPCYKELHEYFNFTNPLEFYTIKMNDRKKSNKSVILNNITII